MKPKKKDEMKNVDVSSFHIEDLRSLKSFKRQNTHI